MLPELENQPSETYFITDADQILSGRHINVVRSTKKLHEELDSFTKSRINILVARCDQFEDRLYALAQGFVSREKVELDRRLRRADSRLGKKLYDRSSGTLSFFRRLSGASLFTSRKPELKEHTRRHARQQIARSRERANDLIPVVRLIGSDIKKHESLPLKLIFRSGWELLVRLLTRLGFIYVAFAVAIIIDWLAPFVQETLRPILGADAHDVTVLLFFGIQMFVFEPYIAKLANKSHWRSFVRLLDVAKKSVTEIMNATSELEEIGQTIAEQERNLG